MHGGAAKASYIYSDVLTCQNGSNFEDRNTIGRLGEVVANAPVESLFVSVCSFSVSRILNSKLEGLQRQWDANSNRDFLRSCISVTLVGPKYFKLYVGLAYPFVQEDDDPLQKIVKFFLARFCTKIRPFDRNQQVEHLQLPK